MYVGVIGHSCLLRLFLGLLLLVASGAALIPDLQTGKLLEFATNQYGWRPMAAVVTRADKLVWLPGWVPGTALVVFPDRSYQLVSVNTPHDYVCAGQADSGDIYGITNNGPVGIFSEVFNH